MEVEQRTFARELPALLPRAGEFALIKGESVIGVYPSWESGVKAGRERFGRVPFMVREIRAERETIDVLSPLG